MKKTDEQELIYLDNGATSFPKPEQVYADMDRFYRQYGVNPGRSGYDLSLETQHMVQNTRQLLTRHFNGTDPDRLIFTHNATDAINIALNGLLSTKDHVITTMAEHNAVLRPLYHHSVDHGVNIEYIPLDDQGFIHPEDIKAAIKPHTRLVVVNHASNVIGTVQPLDDIGKICKEKKVLFLVDASQTAGKIPIDINTSHIDIIAFTGHKSLMGPTGIGGLYVKEGIDIRHTRAGGTGVKSAQKHHLNEYPYRLECGTLNILGIAGLFSGVSWVLDQGIHTLHAHEMKLTQKLRDGLDAIENVITYCADDLTDHIGVLSFNVQGFEAVNTGTLLDGEYNIACRTGLHCAPLVHDALGTIDIGGTVRMGIGPFNTEAEIDKTITAVQQIAREHGK